MNIKDLLVTCSVVHRPEVVIEAVRRVAGGITDAFQSDSPVVLVVMRGGLYFAGQLLPLLPFPLELDYVDVARYGDKQKGGEIWWKGFPSTSLVNRTVLVVDDIVDEGETLLAIHKWAITARARAFYCATLFSKDTGKDKSWVPEFIGLSVPNKFVFGCGMDVEGYGRNLPAVYALGK